MAPVPKYRRTNNSMRVAAEAQASQSASSNQQQQPATDRLFTVRERLQHLGLSHLVDPSRIPELEAAIAAEYFRRHGVHPPSVARP